MDIRSMKYNIFKLSFDERVERLKYAYIQELFEAEQEQFKPRQSILESNQVSIFKQECKEKSYLKSFHIVYVLSNPSICGASKIIFEQANRLMKKGAMVSIVSYAPKPEWYPVNASFIKASSKIRLAAVIPECDIIVATYYTHIQECIETEIAPVIYFEQGDVHLFNFKALEKRHRDFVYKQYQLPSFIMTVSEPAAKLIKKHFGRNAKVFNNAINHSVFFDITKTITKANTLQGESLLKEETEASKKKPRYILIIGRGDVQFKGIHFLIETYERLKERYKDLLLYWATPCLEDKALKERVTRIIVSPTQEELAKLYQNAFVYISGSRYESFSLCVIEAMACGCPVITSKNAGISSYGRNGHNTLIYQPFSTKALINHIEKLLNDESLRNRLLLNGQITASKYKWNVVIDELFLFYTKIAGYNLKKKSRNRLMGEVNTLQEIMDYAVELYNNHQFDEAISFFNEFLELYDGDVEKKLVAERKRYQSYYYKKDYKKARSLCYNCFEYGCPRAEECYFLGLTYLKETDFDLAIFWFEIAVNAKRGESYFIEDEALWTWKPHLQLCVCYYHKGNTQKAIQHNDLAYQYVPENESVLYNKSFFDKEAQQVY